MDKGKPNWFLMALLMCATDDNVIPKELNTLSSESKKEIREKITEYLKQHEDNQ